MQFKPGKALIKIVKYTGISLGVLLLFMFLLPVLFPSFVSDKIKGWANNSIESTLNFSKARLSFFNHFPSLTLTLYDVSLTGSAPFKKDTLVVAKEMAFGVDLASLLGKTIHIDEVYITKGNLNVLVNKQGQPNYNIYINKDTITTKQSKDSSTAALKLERIQIEQCALTYNDQSIPMVITAQQLDYVGKGDLSKAIFDLSSEVKMQAVNFSYDGQQYVENKNLNAQLITKINTHSLSFIFEKNNLRINQLPVSFNGFFDFLKNGYKMDFNLKTGRTAFKNLFTALPPAAVTWINKTTVEGDIEMDASLKGSYIAAESIAPDLRFNMLIKQGSIAAKKIKDPVEDIFINFHFTLPGLNTDKLKIEVDSLHARLGKDEVGLKLKTEGLTYPHVKGNLGVRADIEKWNRTLAIDETLDLKGQLNIAANFNGQLNMAAQKFPVTNATIILKDGFIKTSYYANPITNLQLNATLNNYAANTESMQLAVAPMNLQFEGAPFTIKANLKNFDNLVYDINANGILNIGRIYQVFAIKGYDVKGSIQTALQLQGSQQAATSGNYQQLKNSGQLAFNHITFHSADFPHPFLIKEGVLRINNDQLIANNLALQYGTTNATLNGYFKNIINYILKNEALEGSIQVNTPAINADEWMALASEEKKTANASDTASATANGVLILPTNLYLQLQANAGSITSNGLTITQCKSNTSLKNGTLTVHNASFRIADAPVAMQATYTGINVRRAYFNYKLKADSFDIQKAYKEIKLFREMATMAENVQGRVSLNYQLSGLLNDSMYPILPTIKGGGTLSLQKIKLKGFKLFSAINKETGKELDANADLSKIDIKSTIDKNILTIEKLKLKVAGFKPKFKGQMSLDGQLNLQCRLGLPPFGIVGIPLSITGNSANPVVKMRRGKKADELSTTDADEEDIKEAQEAELKLNKEGGQ